MDAIFVGSAMQLRRDELLDISVIHGDGTTNAAKKGGDNIRISGHKKAERRQGRGVLRSALQRVAPFMSAPGNHNESPLLREALPEVMRIAREVGMDLQDSIDSRDGVYDCRRNHRAIFNRGMIPNIIRIRGVEDSPSGPQAAV